MAWRNRGGEAVTLTQRQKELLESFDLPTNFEALTDEQYFAIDERMSSEMQIKGLANDGLNEYGDLCESVILALPE